jgi:hypothetical protein
VVKFYEKPSKFSGGGHYPAAHNGLVAGSSPAGPTSDFFVDQLLPVFDHRTGNADGAAVDSVARGIRQCPFFSSIARPWAAFVAEEAV